MLASITSTVFIRLITYSTKLYFFFNQLSYSWASILKHQAPASFSISSVPWHMYKEFPVQSVLFSRSVMSDSLQLHGLKLSRLPCSSPPPRACSNSCPSSQQCHPTISSSVVPFSSHLQSFPASGSFPSSQFLTSGGQSIGVSASASELTMNIQDQFPIGNSVQ